MSFQIHSKSPLKGYPLGKYSFLWLSFTSHKALILWCNILIGRFFPSTIFTSFAYRFLNQFNHPGGSFLYESNKCVNSLNIFIEHHVLNFWNYILIVDTKLSSSEGRWDILQSRNLPKVLFQYPLHSWLPKVYYRQKLMIKSGL